MQQGYDQYYNRLGLAPGASVQEIKKQYRKLVLIYHPDKNNGDDSTFLIIREAYEILTDKKKLPPPVKTSRSSSTASEKSKEERVKDAKLRYQEYIHNQTVENERYFSQLTSGLKWRLLKLNAVLGTLIGLMLVIEIFLPQHFTPMKITYYSQQVYSSLDQSNVSLVELASGQSYFIKNLDADFYRNYPSGYISKTWFFHNPKSLLSDHGYMYKEYPIHFTIGSHPYIFCFLFLIPLFTVIYKRKNILFTFLYQLSFYGIGILLLYFLFTNDRWIHLVTLGFL